MDSKLEEEYVFHRLADVDFAQATASIGRVKTVQGYLKFCLLRDATTAYCRPFKTCRGKFGSYKLTEKVVPKNRRTLHKQLVDLRDEVFAHTDINARSPVLACWPGSRYPIQLKAYDYEGLLGQLDQMESLFSAVREIASMKMLTLQSQLPSAPGKHKFLSFSNSRS